MVTVVDISDNEISEDEGQLTRLAAPASTPRLALPIPSLIGNGGHIFPTPIPQPLGNPAPSPNTVTARDYPDFNQYRQHLRYRGPHDAEDAKILHPTEGDVGDGDAWYYVMIGRNVGVFNAW